MPCLVDVAGSRDAAWPDRLRRRTRLAQDMLRCDVGGHTGVLPTLSRLFSLAVSASALALIPSPRQLHCGIMIRSVSKEL